MEEKTPARPRTAVEEIIHEAFIQGENIAHDPQNAFIGIFQIHTTSDTSEWVLAPCKHCQLTFRQGDQVRLCPNCRNPLHEDGHFDLKCWSTRLQAKQNCPHCNEALPQQTEIAKNQPDKLTGQGEEHLVALMQQAIYTEFTEGLKEHWIAFGEKDGQVETRVVQSKDEPSYGKPCMMCRYELRLGDRYVLSPCGCGAHFHADILRHLNCWNIRYEGKEKEDFRCLVHNMKCSEYSQKKLQQR